MQYLKADTAATILIGPFVAPADGVTPVTDITLGAADHAELMKHDGTTFVDLTSDSRTFTHKEGGFYTLALATGDMDTEGRLTVVIMDTSACLPVWKDFMVVNANVFDSLFAAATTDYLQVDTIQVTGTSQTANDNGADINAILTDTAEIGVAGAGLSDLGGMSTGMKAEVESECNDALVAQKLDHLVAVADGDDPVNNSIIAHLVSKDATADWSDYDNQTESLEALHDGPLADIETDTQELQTDLGDFSGRTNDQTLLDVLGVPDVANKDLHTLLVTDRLDHATYGLSALETLVDQVEGYADLIDDATNGLAAIKAEVEGLAGAAMRGTDSAATATALSSHDGKLDTADTVVDGIQTDLSNATDGLGALKALIDAVQTQVDTTGVALLAAAVDAIWDESLTGHSTANSGGLELRQLWTTLVVRVDQCGDAGSASTIDLNSGASGVTDYYKGQLIVLTGGTGAGQARSCTAYNGTSNVATVSPDWATAPDGDSWFAIINTGSTVPVTTAVTPASVADAVWDETLSDHQAAGDTGRALKQATGRKLLD